MSIEYGKRAEHSSRKAGRGGGSGQAQALPSSLRRTLGERHKPTPRVLTKRVPSYDANEDIDANHDFSDEEKYDLGQADATCKDQAHVAEYGACCVCYAQSSLIPLMKKCDHSAACCACLREIYVKQAQQDVNNYPLQCFYPSCTRLVRQSQLSNHGIFRSNDEIEHHYRLTTLAKSYGQSRAVVVHCPHCDHPRKYIKPRGDTKMHVFRCMACTRTFAHDNTQFIETRAIEENDGWAYCPKCGILINKGGGCDHMTCICGVRFDWGREAREKERCLTKKKQVALASTTHHVEETVIPSSRPTQQD